VTLLSKLVDAMPKSSRRKALIAWASAHAPVQYQQKQEQFKLRKKREDADWHLDEADAVPFWDFTKEKNPTQYDLQKAINGFVKSLKKANEQGNLNASRESIEQQVHEALVSFEA